MSRSSTTAPGSPLPSLTGLRWVAAFVVFAYHARNVGYFSGSAQDVMSAMFGAGAAGVSLFFILSGFVLAWADDEGMTPLTFWRRRFARIMPVHLVVLVGALILAATVIPQIRTTDSMAIAADATLLSGWNPDWWQAGNPVSWSLVCEAFFYLTFPLLILLLRPLAGRYLAVVAGVALALVFALAAFNTQLPPFIGANSSPVGRLPEFVLGVCLARMLATGFWRGPRLLPAAVLAIAAYAVDSFSAPSAFSTVSFTIVGFALLICALARADIEGRPTVLSSRTFVRLGTLSFSFYLGHVLVLQSLAALWPGGQPGLALLPAVALTGAALVLSLAVAQILNRRVEEPARRLLVGSWTRPARTPASRIPTRAESVPSPR